jgi:NAD(P)H-nitrite reductase large subunit
MKEEEIIKGLQIVCKCKAVRYKTIKTAIEKGAITIDMVRKKTGANTGCGMQCTEKIKNMISNHLTEKLV